MDADAVLAGKLRAVLPALNERQRRLVLAAEARALGRGGVARVARAAGVSRPTVHLGLRELAVGSLAELRYTLLLAKDLGLISTDDWARVESMRSEAGRLTWGLCRAMDRAEP